MANPFDIKQPESRIVYDKELYGAVSSAVLQTPFSVNTPGSGIFRLFHQTSNCFMELTLDGNIVINDRQMTDNTSYGGSGVWDISWRRSCKIRARHAGGVDNLYLVGSYQDRRTDGRRIPDKELYFTTSSATLVTAKELSGAGEIQFQIINEILAATYMQVTVDGNVIVTDREIISGTLGGTSGVFRYPFDRSFKLEVREAGASNAIVSGFYWNR